MEENYHMKKLGAKEIYLRRYSKKTTRIINQIKTEFYNIVENPAESRNELMSKALNYLKSFWSQILTYRNDCEYSIDNLPAA